MNWLPLMRKLGDNRSHLLWRKEGLIWRRTSVHFLFRMFKEPEVGSCFLPLFLMWEPLCPSVSSVFLSVCLSVQAPTLHGPAVGTHTGVHRSGQQSRELRACSQVSVLSSVDSELRGL